jgi:hypothetical protein
MALAYLGVSRSQEELARKLGLRPRLGVPASNITRLRSASLDILYTDGILEDVANWLTQGAPVFAFVQAGLNFPIGVTIFFSMRPSSPVWMSRRCIYSIRQQKLHPSQLPSGIFC